MPFCGIKKQSNTVALLLLFCIVRLSSLCFIGRTAEIYRMDARATVVFQLLQQGKAQTAQNLQVAVVGMPSAGIDGKGGEGMDHFSIKAGHEPLPSKIGMDHTGGSIYVGSALNFIAGMVEFEGHKSRNAAFFQRHDHRLTFHGGIIGIDSVSAAIA